MHPAAKCALALLLAVLTLFILYLDFGQPVQATDVGDGFYSFVFPHKKHDKPNFQERASGEYSHIFKSKGAKPKESKPASQRSNQRSQQSKEHRSKPTQQQQQDPYQRATAGQRQRSFPRYQKQGDHHFFSQHPFDFLRSFHFPTDGGSNRYFTTKRQSSQQWSFPNFQNQQWTFYSGRQGGQGQSGQGQPMMPDESKEIANSYKTLGIPRNATVDTVKKAYRKLARK